ncbi:hypothetical protein ACHAXA_001480 [Cyclostephanos tholiformis]|uniref:Uncharacterized protein n=1 Tax=Cyclostephanos tholiformis TaxID=382380 RepID=A0ABD3RZ29_9STRA
MTTFRSSKEAAYRRRLLALVLMAMTSYITCEGRNVLVEKDQIFQLRSSSGKSHSDEQFSPFSHLNQLLQVGNSRRSFSLEEWASTDSRGSKSEKEETSKKSSKSGKSSKSLNMESIAHPNSTMQAMLSPEPNTSGPTTSVLPSAFPSLSSKPTSSMRPSDSPTVTMHPSMRPSFHPSESPSVSFKPTVSSQPTLSPTDSSQPTSSSHPTLSPNDSSQPPSAVGDASSITTDLNTNGFGLEDNEPASNSGMEDTKSTPNSGEVSGASLRFRAVSLAVLSASAIFYTIYV